MDIILKIDVVYVSLLKKYAPVLQCVKVESCYGMPSNKQLQEGILYDTFLYECMCNVGVPLQKLSYRYASLLKVCLTQLLILK